MKEGKKDRAVWDESTKLYPLEIVMAEVTPIEFEAEIDFGESKMCCYFKFTTYALTSRLP